MPSIRPPYHFTTHCFLAVYGTIPWLWVPTSDSNNATAVCNNVVAQDLYSSDRNIATVLVITMLVTLYITLLYPFVSPLG